MAERDPDRVETGTFHQVLGYEVTAWREGYACYEMPIQSHHLNRQGTLHGGVLSAIMDAVGMSAATWTPEGPRRAMTLSLSCSFVATITAGTVKAEAWLTGGGRSTFFAEMKASEAGTGRLLATAQGVFRYAKMP